MNSVKNIPGVSSRSLELCIRDLIESTQAESRLSPFYRQGNEAQRGGVAEARPCWPLCYLFRSYSPTPPRVCLHQLLPDAVEKREETTQANARYKALNTQEMCRRELLVFQDMNEQSPFFPAPTTPPPPYPVIVTANQGHPDKSSKCIF